MTLAFFKEQNSGFFKTRTRILGNLLRRAVQKIHNTARTDYKQFLFNIASSEAKTSDRTSCTL